MLFTAQYTQCQSGIAIVNRLSVCPSVRPSVMLMYPGHIGWTSWKLITRIISLGSSLLGATTSPIQSKGTPLKFGWNKGGVALLRKPAISLKRGKIGPRLLLMTNRKSHTRFRLVPKSTTLDDLGGPLRTVFQLHPSFGAHHGNLNEDRPILSATIMQPNDSRFQQYNVYTDIRGGSQDLCKFSLDFMPAP